MMLNEQKISFQGAAHFFRPSTLWVVIFNEIILFFRDFSELLKSYIMDRVTKQAKVFLMSIKWTYLVLWVNS